MLINAEGCHCVLVLTKDQLDTIELSLKDSIDQHITHDLFAPDTVLMMQLLLFQIGQFTV
jgi:hypothetical protein